MTWLTSVWPPCPCPEWPSPPSPGRHSLTLSRWSVTTWTGQSPRWTTLQGRGSFQATRAIIFMLPLKGHIAIVVSVCLYIRHSMSWDVCFFNSQIFTLFLVCELTYKTLCFGPLIFDKVTGLGLGNFILNKHGLEKIFWNAFRYWWFFWCVSLPTWLADWVWISFRFIDFFTKFTCGLST